VIHHILSLLSSSYLVATVVHFETAHIPIPLHIGDLRREFDCPLATRGKSRELRLKISSPEALEHT
jgi:hypothetical protein